MWSRPESRRFRSKWLCTYVLAVRWCGAGVVLLLALVCMVCSGMKRLTAAGAVSHSPMFQKDPEADIEEFLLQSLTTEEGVRHLSFWVGLVGVDKQTCLLARFGYILDTYIFSRQK